MGKLFEFPVAAVQLPHFLSLAWFSRADYARGGYSMMPLTDATGRRTAACCLRNSLYLLPAGLLAWHLGVASSYFATEAGIMAGQGFLDGQCVSGPKRLPATNCACSLGFLDTLEKCNARFRTLGSPHYVAGFPRQSKSCPQHRSQLCFRHHGHPSCPFLPQPHQHCSQEPVPCQPLVHLCVHGETIQNIQVMLGAQQSAHIVAVLKTSLPTCAHASVVLCSIHRPHCRSELRRSSWSRGTHTLCTLLCAGGIDCTQISREAPHRCREQPAAWCFPWAEPSHRGTADQYSSECHRHKFSA